MIAGALPWSDRNIHRPPDHIPAQTDRRQGPKFKEDPDRIICLACQEITCETGCCEIFPERGKRAAHGAATP